MHSPYQMYKEAKPKWQAMIENGLSPHSIRRIEAAANSEPARVAALTPAQRDTGIADIMKRTTTTRLEREKWAPRGFIPNSNDSSVFPYRGTLTGRADLTDFRRRLRGEDPVSWITGFSSKHPDAYMLQYGSDPGYRKWDKANILQRRQAAQYGQASVPFPRIYPPVNLPADIPPNAHTSATARGIVSDLNSAAQKQAAAKWQKMMLQGNLSDNSIRRLGFHGRMEGYQLDDHVFGNRSDADMRAAVMSRRGPTNADSHLERGAIYNSIPDENHDAIRGFRQRLRQPGEHLPVPSLPRDVAPNQHVSPSLRSTVSDLHSGTLNRFNPSPYAGHQQAMQKYPKW